MYAPYGEQLLNQQSTSYNERFAFTGKERDAETGYYYHGARNQWSLLGWLSVDPLADTYIQNTPYMYCSGNPVVRIDPDGRADYYDIDGNHLCNDGVDDNKVFQQSDQGERILGGYATPFAEIGIVEKTLLTYNGKMEENNHISTGSLSLIQCVGNKEFTRAVFSAISGSRKKNGGYYHTLPNGEYQSSNFRIRTESSMVRDGVGFSINLSDIGNRTLLRIHPDGDGRGTQGCIGLNGTVEELQQFVSLVGTLFTKGLNPAVNVNIEGNPQYFKP